MSRKPHVPSGNRFTSCRPHRKHARASRAPRRDTCPTLARTGHRDRSYNKRMGRCAKWASSNGNDFNYDYHVSFTREEIAAISRAARRNRLTSLGACIMTGCPHITHGDQRLGLDGRNLRDGGHEGRSSRVTLVPSISALSSGDGASVSLSEIESIIRSSAVTIPNQRHHVWREPSE